MSNTLINVCFWPCAKVNHTISLDFEFPQTEDLKLSYSLNPNGKDFYDARTIMFLSFIHAMQVQGISKEPATMQLHSGFVQL